MSYWDRERVPLKKVRRKLDKPLADAVEKLMGDGWSVVDGGHCYVLICKCGPPEGKSIQLGGTVKNPTWAARKILSTARHCPKKHDLIY